jgi:putative transposase
MFYFICDLQKQNTFNVYLLCSVFLFFRFIIKKSSYNRLSSCLIKRNRVSVWNWIQKYRPKKVSSTKRKVEEFIIDETLIKIGSELVWIWISIDIKSKEILEFSISRERNMLIAERFLLSKNIDKYGKHPVSSDGGT